MARMMVTVIGIGQSMRGDDAAGLEAVRRWQRSYADTAAHPGVRVQFAELPGLALLDMLEGIDAAVLVDAVQGAAPPGTVHRLTLDQLDSFSSGAKSAHGWGVAETLRLGRQLGTLNPNLRIRLVGIEAAQMDIGAQLSGAVEASLAAAAEAIEAEVLQALA